MPSNSGWDTSGQVGGASAARPRPSPDASSGRRPCFPPRRGTTLAPPPGASGDPGLVFGSQVVESASCLQGAAAGGPGPSVDSLAPAPLL